MRDPDQFDAFYRDARERLLLQTYALTGDLAASRAAVRDAFVVAWHHWRKLARLEDPEHAVRPMAWRYALRRATARVWHRERGISEGVRATLDALGRLPLSERKALLLTQLAAVSMPEMAREVGVPVEEAERQLQTATAQFGVHRDVPTASVRLLLEELRGPVTEVRWPRATIVRRAGAARRRTHTAVGAVAAVTALVVSGSFVTQAGGARPTLDRDRVVAAQPGRDPVAVAEPPEVALPDQALLSTDEVARATDAGRRWTVRTHDNSEGDGRVLPCQRDRYADPRGVAALVRTFRPFAAVRAGATEGSRGARTDVRVVQLAEASATPAGARRAYRRLVGWYSGCAEIRMQLLGARQPRAVGEEAVQLVLRSWAEPVTTYVVGVARTGRLTTSTVSAAGGDAAPDVAAASRLLGAAVDDLCALPDGGRCSGSTALDPVAPPPVGPAPGMLVELDLPPVTRGGERVRRPWVGTQPRKALSNLASTRCDQAAFSGSFRDARFSNNVTRSFVIPGAKLPDAFGLTETVGSLPAPQAAAFVDLVRQRLASCPDEDLGTDVVRLTHREGRDIDLTVWQLTTEVSDDRTLRYLMAVLRDGTSVAQIGFVTAPAARLGDGGFLPIAERALQRLGQLPPPPRKKGAVGRPAKGR